MSSTPKRGRGKNKVFLLKRLQDMYGDDFHPIMKMAENADKAQRLIDGYEKDPESDPQTLFAGLKFAVDAWDKVANYTEPKLKAVEVSGDVDHSGGISITWKAESE